MADRGKGIPLEKRINISGKMGRAVFAVTAVTAAVFWLSGSAAAMEAQEPIQMVDTSGRIYCIVS